MSAQTPADPSSSSGPAGNGPQPAPTAPRPPVRTNLPLKSAPVVGRRAEMHAIATIFERARQNGRPGRVEVVGRRGVGASTVALELARRAGSRMPGGAWYVDASLGADLAWGDVAATRTGSLVKDLRALVREEKERLAAGPQAVLVVDHVRSGDDYLACMPLESRTPPFTFVVCEQPTGLSEDVVHVSDAPQHGARRMSQALLVGSGQQPGPDGKIPGPAVRVLDGLGLTTSIAARAALAWQGRGGPMIVEDTLTAIHRLVPLLANRPATLELLLLLSVLHPSRVAVDALYSAIGHVRAGRGGEPKPEEIGQAVLMLAQAGLVNPDDDRRVSIHPIVQECVRTMAQSPEDLRIAREAAAAGLVAEAKDAMTEEGVRLPTCGLHQLRHLEGFLEGDPKDAVTAARTELEKRLGLSV